MLAIIGRGTDVCLGAASKNPTMINKAHNSPVRGKRGTFIVIYRQTRNTPPSPPQRARRQGKYFVRSIVAALSVLRGV